MIINFYKSRIYILFIYGLYKYLCIFSMKIFFEKTKQKKFNLKKNLFFKKKSNKNFFMSKRLAVILKKKPKLEFTTIKNIDNGNFFFKKFFFKSLLKNRKFFKNFFFMSKKTRQDKITKNICKKNICKNFSYEYNILNILLRSHFLFFYRDVISCLLSGFIYINGVIVFDKDTLVSVGDCVQLLIFKKLYKYIKFCKTFFKTKIALFKYNFWKFFKQKLLQQKQQKKKKNPKYLHLFFIFKLNVPKFLEVDYSTLTIFFLKKQNAFIQTSYYLNKLFSFKLFSLYNFKKIN